MALRSEFQRRHISSPPAGNRVLSPGRVTSPEIKWVGFTERGILSLTHSFLRGIRKKVPVVLVLKIQFCADVTTERDKHTIPGHFRAMHLCNVRMMQSGHMRVETMQSRYLIFLKGGLTGK